MTDSWKQSVVVAVVVIAATMGGAALQAWSLHHAPEPASAPVLVWDQVGAPVTFTQPRDAMDYASSIAGFRVARPTYLPPGYSLVEIDVPAKPAPPAFSAPMVFFTIFNGRTGFHIFVINLQVSFAGDPSQVIATPWAGTQVVKSVNDQNTFYNFITPTREVSIETGVPSPLTDAEAVRILTSLPRD